jgi:hypothetical protein
VQWAALLVAAAGLRALRRCLAAAIRQRSAAAKQQASSQQAQAATGWLHSSAYLVGT